MKAAETVEIPTSAIMRHRSAGPTDLAARFSGGRSLTDAAMTVGGARWVARSAASQWRRGVSIGEVLAGARRQAGLTVSQVSHRTRIRETIITAIEGDDYAPCGGDFYARGHIRSIARVVGTDSEPLIHEYDTTHGAPQAIRAADVFEPATPIKLKERRSPNWSLAMILVLALVVGYGVYRAVGAVTSPGRPAVAAPPSHHPSAAAAAPSTPAPTPTHVSHT